MYFKVRRLWGWRVPVDTERKLNVHKTFRRHPKTSWTSSERLMYVQFTSCVYGGILNWVSISMGRRSLEGRTYLKSRRFLKEIQYLGFISFLVVFLCFLSLSICYKKRSSRQEVFYIKKSVLKICTKFTGKHLCRSLFLNKVAEYFFL